MCVALLSLTCCIGGHWPDEPDAAVGGDRGNT